MRAPVARGPLSGEVLRIIGEGTSAGHDPRRFAALVDRVADPLRNGDLQLALACCYELHYRGFDEEGDSTALEWDPDLIALRRLLEQRFEEAVREAVPPVPAELLEQPVPEALQAVVDADTGPALSTFLMRSATLEQFRQFVVQRSVYNLKEADPHTWQIPRLSGRTKEALVEIQSDEYGGGRPGRTHATLFARMMTALGLDPTYGRYWDDALPETLATVNLMSLLGLHRRHRGAALGHLAALEMTSTAPNRRYGNGLRRLGLGPEATFYFDEHVEADAVHEQVAATDMCGSFAAVEPDLRGDVLWGATACLVLDARAATALMEQWGAAGQAGAA